MCQWLTVDDRRITSTTELVALVGRDKVVLSPGGQGPSDWVDEYLTTDSCLCHVDLRATARRAGYRNLPQRRAGDPLNVRWRKIPTPPEPRDV